MERETAGNREKRDMNANIEETGMERLSMNNSKYRILEFRDASAYVLEDETLDDNAQYRILQNTASDCTVCCMPEFRNGKKEYYYLTGKLKKMPEAAETMQSTEFIAVVRNLLFAYRYIENTGFLSVRNLELQADRIYVEPETGKVRFLYVPIKTALYETEHDAEKKLKQEIGKLIECKPELSLSGDIRYLEDYLDSSMSAEEYLQNCQSGRTEKPVSQAGWTQTARQQTCRELHIICESNPNRFFRVNKVSFVIGKKASEVDGVVDGSRLVSRVHCEAVSRNGIWYIKDRNSSNGTFLNGVKLIPETLMEIHDGDALKLADVKYQIRIY